MGIFSSKEAEEEKNKKKLEELIEKYKLSDLPEDDCELLPSIASCFAGNDWNEIGSLLSGNDVAMLRNIASSNKALFLQNWIMIRQLNRLNNNIEKILKNKF